MADVTAVILSALPIKRQVDGCDTLVHSSRFNDAAGLLEARFAAMARVQTPWFFFLDDDDELPEGYADVLDQCMSAGAPLAYTDEIIRTPRGDHRRTGQPYSQEAHKANNMLVHHLAVCQTEQALNALNKLPRGQYGFEPLFYWELAKSGAAYIPEAGYIWNVNAGMHRNPSVRLGMARSTLWGVANP